MSGFIETRKLPEQLDGSIDSLSKLRQTLIDHDCDWLGFESSLNKYKYPFKIAHTILDSLDLPKDNVQIAKTLMHKGYVNPIAAQRSYILGVRPDGTDLSQNREARIMLPQLLHTLEVLPEDEYMRAEPNSSEEQGFFPVLTENSYFIKLLMMGGKIIDDQVITGKNARWPQQILTASTNITGITVEISIDLKQVENASRYPTTIDIDHIAFLAAPQAFEKFDPFSQYREHSYWI